MAQSFQERSVHIVLNTNNVLSSHEETVPYGKRIAFCRCWQSEKFPYCDGSHNKVNSEKGDNVGPVKVTAVPEEEAANQ
jgi:CDGSH-type Zn-finger protein